MSTNNHYNRPDYFGDRVKRWDTYFHKICEAVASKSPCMSRKIGAILVLDNSILSTGYNGPPRGVPHCGHERFEKDEMLNFAASTKEFDELGFRSLIGTTCPRQLMGYESAQYLNLCTAQHAEENAVSNAARNGTCVKGSTLYMNSVIPCGNCFGTLVNAGITCIVVDELTHYDKKSAFFVNNIEIKVRKFNL